jgi:hypothetical protein
MMKYSWITFICFRTTWLAILKFAGDFWASEMRQIKQGWFGPAAWFTTKPGTVAVVAGVLYQRQNISTLGLHTIGRLPEELPYRVNS